MGQSRKSKIYVNNYQGTITIDSLFADKIEWFLDDKKIKTKYNVVGKFLTKFSVKDLIGKSLHFKLSNNHGYLVSKYFYLEEWK